MRQDEEEKKRREEVWRREKNFAAKAGVKAAVELPLQIVDSMD